MLSLTQKLSQQQKLTPQQLQYLKLLQLPVVALEQRIKEELEINPLLEETGQDLETPETDAAEADSAEEEIDWEEVLKSQEDDRYARSASGSEQDRPDFIQESEESIADRLLAQLRMQPLTEDQLILAEEIIGNIDADGYLRRDLLEIVQDLNKFISETLTDADAGEMPDHPFGRDRLLLRDREVEADPPAASDETEPAGDEAPETDTRSMKDLSLEEMATLSIDELARILERGTSSRKNGSAISRQIDSTESPGESGGPDGDAVDPTGHYSLDDAEDILTRIQRLDPPGIGSRDLRECLLVQLELSEEDSDAADLAERIIRDTYREFTMKHFEKICSRLGCTEDELREAMGIITSLNPKPGEGNESSMNNYITPDFVIRREGEDFIIIPNDRYIPTLRISPDYRAMLQPGSSDGVDRDARRFLRQKLEAAKWFIASIRQRRQTMMRVMQTIVELQDEFFRSGSDSLKPMIYKDVAEKINMDISTVCRVVNGKYVQTDYGVFELRYFFSEALETVTGEEVSNKVVKARIRELIEAEDKDKPLSDEAISARMKEAGYNVARRTVAKYREQMHLPVARLRRTL